MSLFKRTPQDDVVLIRSVLTTERMMREQVFKGQPQKLHTKLAEIDRALESLDRIVVAIPTKNFEIGQALGDVDRRVAKLPEVAAKGTRPEVKAYASDIYSYFQVLKKEMGRI